MRGERVEGGGREEGGGEGGRVGVHNKEGENCKG